jgi:hypothetical protein
MPARPCVGQVPLKIPETLDGTKCGVKQYADSGVDTWNHTTNYYPEG